MSKNKLILWAMCLGIFVVMLDTTIMNIALPEIQVSLHTDLTKLSWALNAYTIVFASLAIPLGKFANIYGKKLFYLLALGFFAGGSLLSGMSQGIGLLVVGRICQSLGAAVIFPLGMDFAIASQPERLKRQATLIVGLTQGSAAAFGPTIGGMITQFWGWRWIFLVNIPIVVLAGVIGLYALPHGVRKANSKIDWLGAGLIIVALVSLNTALIQARFWGWGLVIDTLLAVFVITSLIFYRYEQRVSDPIIDFALFHQFDYNMAAVATLVGQFLLVGFMVIMPTFLTTMFAKSAFQSALLVTPTTVMIFILSPLAGLITRLVKPKLLLALGFALTGLGYLGLATLSAELNYPLYLAYASLVGAGYGVIIGPISILSTVGFKGELLTAAQSVIGVLRQVGTVLAVAVFVSLLNLNLARAKNHAMDYLQTETQSLSAVNRSKIQDNFKQKIGHAGTTTKLPNKNELVATHYQEYLAQHQLTEVQLNSTAIATIKAEISRSVDQQLQLIVKIADRIKIEYVAAFTKLYCYTAPLAFLVALVFCLLPTKKIE